MVADFQSAAPAPPPAITHATWGIEHHRSAASGDKPRQPEDRGARVSRRGADDPLLVATPNAQGVQVAGLMLP
jgi:hypothetical protein